MWGDIPAKGSRIHPRPEAVAFCRRGERTSYIGLTLYGNFPIIKMGDLFDDGEPQAAAENVLSILVQEMLHVINGTEHMFCILATNTDTIPTADASFSNDLRLTG
jgi:hypothetical protein